MIYVVETETDDFQIEVPANARVSVRGYSKGDWRALEVQVPMKPEDNDSPFGIDWNTIALYEDIKNFRCLDNTKRIDEVVA